MQVTAGTSRNVVNSDNTCASPKRGPPSGSGRARAARVRRAARRGGPARLRAGLARPWAVMRLHRADGERDGAGGPGPHREQDPQVRRCQLLPQPGQRVRQGGLPGVAGIGGVELDEGNLLEPVKRGRERRRRPVVGFPIGAGRDPEGRDGAAARGEPLREVQRAVGGLERLAVVQRAWRPAVGGPEVRLDERGGAEGAGVAQREVGRAVTAGGVAAAPHSKGSWLTR